MGVESKISTTKTGTKQVKDYKGIAQTIRNFLFSKTNKEFLVFMFFLALSGIFWLLMALNETLEKEVRIPVRIVNIPDNVVLTSNEADTIVVVLRDKGLVLAGYKFSNRMQTIKLRFREYIKRDGYGMVTVAELQKLITANLPASTSITEIKTELIEFYYSNGKSKRVPVKWTGQVTPEQPYFISEVLYYPDSVDVYAQEEKLDSIINIGTMPLNRSDFRDSLVVTANLQNDKDFKTVPDKVTIKFLTDILTEESFDNIPVKAINLPKGKTLRTFPAKVSVHFITGVNRYKEIKPSDFSVVADFNEIAALHPDKCTISLAKAPKGISRTSLSVSKVDYLIEDEAEITKDTTIVASTESEEQ